MSLQKIQSALKAPKGQWNKFGKYSYRNCEDILEALKPLLAEHEYSLVITDDIALVGDRHYLKADVVLADKAGKVVATNSGFAREPFQKKGMDESQITGTASSYARKYALNGMFLIDDTKDADTDEHTKAVNEGKQREPRVPHKEQFDLNIEAMAKSQNIEMLRLLTTEAAKYFHGWNQPKLVEQIKAKGVEFSKRFESEKAA